MDLGCYPAHWIRELGGAEPTVTHASFIPNELGADITIDASLRFDDGPHAGATATLHASMAPGVAFDASVVVTGSAGNLRVENLVLPHKGHCLTETVGDIVRTWTVGARETYDHELDAVAAALTRGERAQTSGYDLIENMRLIDAIYAEAGLARGGL